MHTLTITAIKDSKNADFKTLLFMQEVTEEIVLSQTAFQIAQGQKATVLTNTRKNAANELVSAEVAAKFKVGQPLSGWYVQGYRSSTPFFFHKDAMQSPVGTAKSNPYFEGAMVPAEAGEGVPAELVVTMDSHPALYSYQGADGKTVRGAAAVALLKMAFASAEQAVKTKQTVAAGDEDDSI